MKRRLLDRTSIDPELSAGDRAGRGYIVPGIAHRGEGCGLLSQPRVRMPPQADIPQHTDEMIVEEGLEPGGQLQVTPVADAEGDSALENRSGHLSDQPLPMDDSGRLIGPEEEM